MGIAAGNIQFSYPQLQRIWIMAGGSPQEAPLAAAVAMAESSGNSAAYNNDSNGTTDRGLWQINSSHGSVSSYDVMTNARYAVALSRGVPSCSLSGFVGWGNWSTYCSGAYRQYLNPSIKPADSVNVNGTSAAQNGKTATGTSTTTTNPPGQVRISGNNPPQNPSGTVNLNPLTVLQDLAGLPAAVTNLPGTITKDLMGAVVSTVLGPILQPVIGILGIAAGGIIVLFGIFAVLSQTRAGQTATQVGAMALAPEAAATTEYTAASGARSTVTQYRRPAVRYRGFQMRPGTSRTTVQRQPAEQSQSTRDTLRNQAREYQTR